MNPEQAACISKANPFLIPNLPCILVAVEGNVWSGVDVATIIRSMFDIEIWEFLIAFCAASKPKSELNCFLSAICLCLIPVLVLIHSSLVFNFLGSSLFLIIFFL